MGNNLLGSLVSGVATGLGTAAKMGEQKAQYDIELKKQRLKQQMADNAEFDNAYKYHSALAASGDQASQRVVDAMNSMRNDPNRSAPPNEFYQHIYKSLEQSEKDKQASMPFIDMLNKLVPPSMQGSPLLPKIAAAEGIQSGAQLGTADDRAKASDKLVDYSQFFPGNGGQQPMVQGGGMSLDPAIVKMVADRRLAAAQAQAKLKGQNEALTEKAKYDALGVPLPGSPQAKKESDDASKVQSAGAQIFSTRLGRLKAQIGPLEETLKHKGETTATYILKDWDAIQKQHDDLAAKIADMEDNQIMLQDQWGKEALAKYRSKGEKTAAKQGKFGPDGSFPTQKDWNDYLAAHPEYKGPK